MDRMRHSTALLPLFCLAALAQDGQLVVGSGHVHQYSGISPVSAKKTKIHAFTSAGGVPGIFAYPAGTPITATAPYPIFRWDNSDDDLGWVIGSEVGSAGAPNAIYTWRVSTQAYTKVIDYAGKFTRIDTGGTSDITWDNWASFWSDPEHTVCAVDLTAKKTYCADFNAADPNNHLPGTTMNVDFVQITARDSKANVHYVILQGTPAAYVYSVNEAAGSLTLILRGPENVYPAMGAQPHQNNDGQCDPGETCVTSPHSAVFQATDGQAYWTMGYGIEDGKGLCGIWHAAMRLNSGLLMSKPENFDGVTGGGMKLILDGKCGPTWPAAEDDGCARNGPVCSISYEVGGPGTDPTRKVAQVWTLTLDSSGNLNYSLVGKTGATGTDYWTQPRAAVTFDGVSAIYDSDAGSNGTTHNVYALATGSPAIPPPAGGGTQPPPTFTTQEIQVLKALADCLIQMIGAIHP